MKTEPVPLGIIFVESTDGGRKHSRIRIVLKMHLKMCKLPAILMFSQSLLSCDGIPEVSNITDTNRLWQEDHLWLSCLFVRLCIKNTFKFLVWNLEFGIWPLALLAWCDCWKMSQWTQYYLHQNQAEMFWLVFIPVACEFQHPNDSQRDNKKDTRMYTEPFIWCMKFAWNLKEKNTQSTWSLLILTAGMKKKRNHVQVSPNQCVHKSLFDISYCKMSAWMQMMSSHCHGDGLGKCIFQKERYVFVD